MTYKNIAIIIIIKITTSKYIRTDKILPSIVYQNLVKNVEVVVINET